MNKPGDGMGVGGACPRGRLFKFDSILPTLEFLKSPLFLHLVVFLFFAQIFPLLFTSLYIFSMVDRAYCHSSSSREPKRERC